MPTLHNVLRISVLLAAFLLPPALASEPPPGLRFEPFELETFDGQTVSVQRGRFSVPENRERPNGRTIELAFVRFPSTSPNPGPPIVYLAGGPGGSGITTARGSRFGLFMALREIGDVIAFDQRGTGDSGGRELRCNETYELPFDQPLDRQGAGEILARNAEACAARLQEAGVDIAGYNTRESAADLEDLRLALGVPKITLWGISYGTHLSLATAARYPSSIDRMILAGIESLDQTYKLPADQEALLGEIASLARSQPAIRAKTPDLLGSVRGLLERLQESPVRVELLDPRSGQPFEIVLGAFDLQVALAGLLRGPETFRFLPDLVARMEVGDFVPLALQMSQDRADDLGSMMSLAMDCASGAGPERLRQISAEAEGTLLADAINYPLPEICAGAPVPDLGNGFRTLPRSEIPALLISGTLDGRTPPGNAEKVLPNLPRAHHLVLEGAGHSDPLFLSSPRILETMLTFLRSGTGAEKELPNRLVASGVEWVAPREAAPLSAELAARVAGAYRFTNGSEVNLIPGGPVLFLMGSRGRPQILRPTPDGDFFVEFDAARVELKETEGAVTGFVWIAADGSRREAGRMEGDGI